MDTLLLPGYMTNLSKKGLSTPLSLFMHCWSLIPNEQKEIAKILAEALPKFILGQSKIPSTIHFTVNNPPPHPIYMHLGQFIPVEINGILIIKWRNYGLEGVFWTTGKYSYFYLLPYYTISKYRCFKGLKNGCG